MSESNKRPIATNTSKHMFSRLTTPYKQEHTQKIIDQVINIFKNMINDEVRSDSSFILRKLIRVRKGVYREVIDTFHVHNILEYLGLPPDYPFGDLKQFIIDINECKKSAAREVLDEIYQMESVNNRDLFITNVFNNFKNKYREKRNAMADKYLLNVRKNEANIFKNVPVNSNMLLTNITTFFQNNSQGRIFQKMLKKNLLNNGIDDEVISKYFLKILQNNYTLPNLFNQYTPRMSSGSYGSVYQNKNINRSKLNQLTVNKLNSTIPIIIKKQNIYNRRKGIDDIASFNNYKEALIQYILYNLSEDRFKLHIPKIYSFRFMEPNYSVTIMQQINGVVLYDYFYRLKKNNIPHPLVIINFMKQLFLLLNYLYTTFGFIHGDIKNNNIMVQNDNTIILLDYGFSSINKLPNFENIHSKFLLCSHKEVYNYLNETHMLKYYDITMLLYMYCEFILTLYLNKGTSSHYQYFGVTDRNKIDQSRIILQSLFLDDTLKNQLIYLIHRSREIPFITLRNKINNVDYTKITYSNLISKINEIEIQLNTLIPPTTPLFP